jgi:hypothetical protein
MKKTLSILIISIFVMSLTFAAKRAPIASLTFFLGSVKYQISGDTADWALAKKGMVFYQGDKLKTETDGKAELYFYTGSKVRIANATEIEFTEVTKKKKNIFVNAGKIWNKVRKGDNYSLETVHGVASVKGTEFDLETSEDGTALKVKEGLVSFKKKKKKEDDSEAKAEAEKKEAEEKAYLEKKEAEKKAFNEKKELDEKDYLEKEKAKELKKKAEEEAYLEKMKTTDETERERMKAERERMRAEEEAEYERMKADHERMRAEEEAEYERMKAEEEAEYERMKAEDERRRAEEEANSGDQYIGAMTQMNINNAGNSNTNQMKASDLSNWQNDFAAKATLMVTAPGSQTEGAPFKINLTLKDAKTRKRFKDDVELTLRSESSELGLAKGEKAGSWGRELKVLVADGRAIVWGKGAKGSHSFSVSGKALTGQTVRVKIKGVINERTVVVKYIGLDNKEHKAELKFKRR